MASAGRKRKAGKREANGRIQRTPANDRGNDFVVARAEAFECFQGGKAEQSIDDPIGRAWAAGLLDGQTIDAAILRDKGRDYGKLYWSYFTALAPRIGELEPRSRSSGDGSDETTPDRQGERFKAMDEIAHDMGRECYRAMQELCIDQYWSPMTNPGWLEGLVNEAMIKANRPVSGPLPTSGDRVDLALAVAALVKMVEGK